MLLFQVIPLPNSFNEGIQKDEYYSMGHYHYLIYWNHYDEPGAEQQLVVAVYSFKVIEWKDCLQILTENYIPTNNMTNQTHFCIKPTKSDAICQLPANGTPLLYTYNKIFPLPGSLLGIVVPTPRILKVCVLLNMLGCKDAIQTMFKSFT